MKVIAVIEHPDELKRILRHLIKELSKESGFPASEVVEKG